MHDAERISAKLMKFRPSLTLELRRLVGERVRAGLPVFDFGLGETKGTLAEHIREAGEAAYREGHTQYGDPAGLHELRAAVLRWLGVADHYGIENVVITAGAKQSLFNIFLAVCNPADCVLFDTAPWVSYQPLAVAAYAFPVMVLPAAGDRNYLKVTPDDLRRNLRMRPHAKLFLLNSPVNPTAQLYSAEELTRLFEVCLEHKIYFVLDRLYWRIVFDGQSFPELPLDDEAKRWLIQVDGLSKNWRRTGGLRVGWSVAPTDVSRAMANLQSHYTSGPATPTQHSALAAICQRYDDEMCRDLQDKRDLLHEHARGIPHVKVWPTPATFYSYWDVRQCFGKRAPEGSEIRSSDDLMRYLIEAAGVVTASGAAFMQDGYMRLSFATPDEEIVAGMRATREVLEQLR